MPGTAPHTFHVGSGGRIWPAWDTWDGRDKGSDEGSDEGSRFGPLTEDGHVRHMRGAVDLSASRR